MPTYEIDGVRPVAHPTGHVDPTAVLVGDVHSGASCCVAPLANLCGDFGRTVVRDGSNVQDGCVMHTFPGTETVIGQDGPEPDRPRLAADASTTVPPDSYRERCR
jgi:phenylacetic acid degradation protein